jgi:GNAT superfamily N-acetyltransferase
MPVQIAALTLPSSRRLPAGFARFQPPLMSTARPQQMTRPDFEIRQAIPADASQLERLYRQLVAGSPVCVVPERLAELLVSEHAYLAVADRSGLLLGTMFLSLCLDPMYGKQPFGVIENIVVAEDARGTGVGTALLEHLQGLALKADCSKLMLSSAADRISAHAFFGRSGFAPNKVGFVKYRRAWTTSERRPDRPVDPDSLSADFAGLPAAGHLQR